MQYFKIGLILLFLIHGGCEYRAQQAREEKRIGINGEAMYVYEKDGQLWGIYKPGYNVYDYQIFIEDDTILAGGVFKSLIRATNSKFTITISSPSEHVIVNDGMHGFKEYTFQPKEKGTYEYRGVIKYDTVRRPFDYKFVVK